MGKDIVNELVEVLLVIIFPFPTAPSRNNKDERN